MDQFLERLQHAITSIKTPMVLLIFVIAMGSVGWNVFIGGHDKRSLVTTLLSLMGFAAVIFYADRIIDWIKRFV